LAIVTVQKDSIADSADRRSVILSFDSQQFCQFDQGGGISEKTGNLETGNTQTRDHPIAAEWLLTVR
jgi:hypothetical protein